MIAFVLWTGRDAPIRERRERRNEAKQQESKAKPSRQERLLGRGSARITFVVGALLSFPGVTYLDALDHIVKLNPGTALTVLLVVYFCVMQQLLLELPLIGYAFAPIGRSTRSPGSGPGWRAADVRPRRSARPRSESCW